MPLRRFRDADFHDYFQRVQYASALDMFSSPLLMLLRCRLLHARQARQSRILREDDADADAAAIFLLILRRRRDITVTPTQRETARVMLRAPMMPPILMPSRLFSSPAASSFSSPLLRYHAVHDALSPLAFFMRTLSFADHAFASQRAAPCAGMERTVC